MKQTIKVTTKEELRSVIKQELQVQGPDADLNHIDISKITDLSNLFQDLSIGNIKIDKWNTSNVKRMVMVFQGCKNFNADISQWDVSNVTDMFSMFGVCYKFNSDLSKWNVDNVENCRYAFCLSKNMNMKKVPKGLRNEYFVLDER